jgi:hypothetical protein
MPGDGNIFSRGNEIVPPQIKKGLANRPQKWQPQRLITDSGVH